MEQKIDELIENRFAYTDLTGTVYYRRYDHNHIHIINALKDLFKSNGFNCRNSSILLTVAYENACHTAFSLSIAFINEDGLHHIVYILED